jgi:hypothetical protein
MIDPDSESSPRNHASVVMLVAIDVNLLPGHSAGLEFDTWIIDHLFIKLRLSLK